MKQILTFCFSPVYTMRYCDSPVRFCAVFAQSQNKFLHKTSQKNRSIAYNTLVRRKMLEFALFNRIISVICNMIFVSKSKSAEKFNTAGSGAFLYLAASCKFLSLVASPAKRFRPCKLRVCSVSTSNQKTTKKISLKVSSNLRESRAVSLSTGNAEERARAR